jgi:ABC-type multidrug transport system fused ATPase/permease subunit
VQQALDNASKGRYVSSSSFPDIMLITRLTITVGHRLSSIKGADVIFVMDQGQVVDQGRHEELLERKGKYFELVQAQL